MSLTPEQEEAAKAIEAEVTGKQASSPAVQQFISQDEENSTYRVVLLPIVQTLSAIACPNWELTQQEHMQLVEAFVPLLKKYVPNIDTGASLPPEVLALLTVAMIAAPRLAARKPMRVYEEETTQQAA